MLKPKASVEPLSWSKSQISLLLGLANKDNNLPKLWRTRRKQIWIPDSEIEVLTLLIMKIHSPPPDSAKFSLLWVVWTDVVSLRIWWFISRWFLYKWQTNLLKVCWFCHPIKGKKNKNWRWKTVKQQTKYGELWNT